MNSNYLWEIERCVCRTKEAMAHLAAPFCERYGMTPLQLRVLLVLHREGPKTTGELARCSGMAAANLSVLAKQLHGRGLVARSRGGHDGRDDRLVLLRLTGQGEGVVEAFVEALGRLEPKRLPQPQVLDELECFAQALEQGAQQMEATFKETRDEQ